MVYGTIPNENWKPYYFMVDVNYITNSIQLHRKCVTTFGETVSFVDYCYGCHFLFFIFIGWIFMKLQKNFIPILVCFISDKYLEKFICVSLQRSCVTSASHDIWILYCIFLSFLVFFFFVVFLWIANVFITYKSERHLVLRMFTHDWFCM